MVHQHWETKKCCGGGGHCKVFIDFERLIDYDKASTYPRNCTLAFNCCKMHGVCQPDVRQLSDDE
jgi:hypothetical protein